MSKTTDSTAFHVVRHPDHAAGFEQFYWDAMAGLVPRDGPRAALLIPVP